MSFNYSLKYRRFDQLVDDVSVDFKGMSLANQIEPQHLIKVAKRINYDLGLRINGTKETVLDITRNVTKLPDDFQTLNFAMICDSGSCTTVFPQGTHMEERPVAASYQETITNTNLCTPSTVNCQKCNCLPCSCSSASCTTSECTPSCSTNTCETPVCNTAYNPLVPYGEYCTKPRTFMNCKGDCYELIQIINPGLTYSWNRLIPVKVIPNDRTIECDCPGLYTSCNYEISIDNNGFLHSNFKNVKLYLNFQGMLEDNEGNLLVPDHDMINEYYEYGLKSRILENLFMNDTPNADKKLQLIEARLSSARSKALNVVLTPNFEELRSIYNTNRKAMYGKYYQMFSSYGPI